MHLAMQILEYISIDVIYNIFNSSYVYINEILYKY